MKELCINEAYKTFRMFSDWQKVATYCKGKSCPNHGKCDGLKEFDKLPKHVPTDYEMEQAINMGISSSRRL